jgi:hypothetical protein
MQNSARALAFMILLSEMSAGAAVRQENFDQEPKNWQGVNNRSAAPGKVTQDFGFMAAQERVGGRITPAAEPAFYAYHLPKPLGFNDHVSASGKLYVAPGAGNFLLGLFNANTLNEWRTPNTMAARINGRGEAGFHCHAEYCTGKWRAGAGLIRKSGQYAFKEIPAGRVYEWRFEYDPGAEPGSGAFKFTLNGDSDIVSIPAEHRADGALFTHFGVLPVLKSVDSPGEFWIDDVTINGRFFDFATDPNWEGLHNRRTYETRNCRPLFDFGWSLTQHAGGKAAGELGGLVFRGDCRYPQRMACCGDPIASLTLKHGLWAAGKIAVTRAVSDSTACFGFYNSAESMRSNPSQQQCIPRNFIGISIEGPSSEGFYFYPVCRTSTRDARIPRMQDCPKIYPDAKTHTWTLQYDPPNALTVTLDGQPCKLSIQTDTEEPATSFDRFGICTTWIDGNAVTMYLDDIEYTCSQP